MSSVCALHEYTILGYNLISSEIFRFEFKDKMRRKEMENSYQDFAEKAKNTKIKTMIPSILPLSLSLSYCRHKEGQKKLKQFVAREAKES